MQLIRKRRFAIRGTQVINSFSQTNLLYFENTIHFICISFSEIDEEHPLFRFLKPYVSPHHLLASLIIGKYVIVFLLENSI